MTDVGFALEAKSDQLNAVDIVGTEPVIRVRNVDVRKSDQPVSIYFDGDNGRPWKPSKGMLRILAGAWGRDSSEWVGKHVRLYFEPSVKYAGEEVGGIRVKALSDIPKDGMKFVITINSKKREPYHVEYLEVQTEQYPEEKFAKALPAMQTKMESGDMTLQQVIAQCQKTGRLSEDQIKRLEDAAPVEVDDDAEPVETGGLTDLDGEIPRGNSTEHDEDDNEEM